MHEWEQACRLADRVRQEARRIGARQVKEVRISLPAWECHDLDELVQLLQGLLSDEPLLLDARFVVVPGPLEVHCKDCGWTASADAGTQHDVPLPAGPRCPNCGSMRVAADDEVAKVSLTAEQNVT
ncbi:MAG: hydrogenase/urease maturation nickel metallochaperone HypA [Armatimonadota bacterium]